MSASIPESSLLAPAIEMPLSPAEIERDRSVNLAPAGTAAIVERLRRRIRAFFGRPDSRRARATSRAGSSLAPSSRSTRIRMQPGSPVWLGVRTVPPDTSETGPAVSIEPTTSPRDRRVSRRHRPSDLPSLRAVRLPWGEDVSVVDFSSTGVRLETTALLPPGSALSLDVLGEATRASVTARVLRARVAAVHAAAARWHVAAAFEEPVDLTPLERAIAPVASSHVLADLLVRVLADQREDGHDPWEERRARFESELAPLVRARAVFLRRTPVVHDPGAESIYFTVPHSTGTPLVLQVLFDAAAQPSAAEFRLLRAAAALAAVIRACSPDAGEGPGAVV